MTNVMHNPVQAHPGKTAGRHRSGVTVIVVLALLAVAMTLFGIWARSTVRQERQLRQRELQLQSYRLAEAGLGRAVARLADDPDYAGETWNVSAEDLGGRYAAQVVITTEAFANGDSALVRVTAEHPVGTVYRAQHTEVATVPITETSPDSESSETGDEP